MEERCDEQLRSQILFLGIPAPAAVSPAIAVLISAIGLTIAFILPPSYQATARLLVESAQIPGDLAQSTVPVNAVEQIEIIQQRLMTRANLISLAERFDIYADAPKECRPTM